MTQKYSKDDVIKYIYGELNPSEEGDFIEAMCSDEELFTYYEELKEVQGELGTARLEPSEFSVNRVLNYARSNPAQSRLARTFPFKGNKKLALTHIAGNMFMVIFTCCTIGLAMYAYKIQTAPAETYVNASLDWDISDLNERIHLARMNMNNISGDRESLIRVFNNTYKLVRTNDFAPASGNIVLLNIE